MNMKAISLVIIGIVAGLALREPASFAYTYVADKVSPPVPLSKEVAEFQAKVAKCKEGGEFLKSRPDLYNDNRLKNCSVDKYTSQGVVTYYIIPEWDVAFGKKAPVPLAPEPSKPPVPPVEAVATQGK